MTSRSQRNNPRVQTLETRHRLALVQLRATVETASSSSQLRWRRLHDPRGRMSLPDTKDWPATYNNRLQTKNPAPSNDSRGAWLRAQRERGRRVRPRLACTTANAVDRFDRRRRRPG